MLNLTNQQFKVFEVIKAHLLNNGFPPTRAEIAEILDFKSVNAAESHIKALVKKGVIEKVPGSSRGIRLIDQLSGIPLIGKIAAGTPITAIENVEKNIPNNPLTQNVDFFLRVQGDSMIEAGILENDLVGIKSCNYAENGEIIAARVDNEVTLKRFKKEGNRAFLKPENAAYSNIEVTGNQDFSIEGRAVGIVRESIY